MPKAGTIRSEKTKAQDKAWRIANPDKVLATSRRYRERHPDRMKEFCKRYAINNPDKIKAKSARQHAANPKRTRDRMRRLREEAATRLRPANCEVCGGTQKRALAWDHDSKTGLFRGWLCSGCNVILGIVKDDVEVLRKLINYLNNKQAQTNERQKDDKTCA